MWRTWCRGAEYRADLGNVLALRKAHHVAFDRYCLRLIRNISVDPEFETDNEVFSGRL